MFWVIETKILIQANRLNNPKHTSNGIRPLVTATITKHGYRPLVTGLWLPAFGYRIHTRIFMKSDVLKVIPEIMEIFVEYQFL